MVQLQESDQHFFQRARPVDIADFLEQQELDEQLRLIHQLDTKLAAAVFSYFPGDLRMTLVRSFDDQKLVSLIQASYPDDRLYILEALDKVKAKNIIGLLDKQSRDEIQTRLNYPKKSVGRLMTPYFVRVRPSWDMDKVFDHLRRYGKHAETFEVVYVIDDDDKLIDEVHLKDVVLSEPTMKVSSLLDGHYSCINEMASQEEALEMMKKVDLNVLPVVDIDKKLIGIVTSDDIFDVAEIEGSEDLEKFSGIEALGERYSRVSIFHLLKKRLTWLTLLFLSGILTVLAMGRFEEKIASKAFVALFVPLIIASGGNTGTQTASLMIRAFALQDIHLKDWGWVIKRELISGFMLSLVLATLGFSLSYIFLKINHPDENTILLSSAIALSLICVVIVGSGVGASLPFILEKLKLDPSISSTPAVTTILDVTGLVIYFTVISFMVGI
ncbi:MAG TPA: magnesium transporter [Bacteriovoracaceae bacterium]|nr:magnesium transporter [Bacteriovoracaceae bacterium]